MVPPKRQARVSLGRAAHQQRACPQAHFAAHLSRALIRLHILQNPPHCRFLQHHILGAVAPFDYGRSRLSQPVKMPSRTINSIGGSAARKRSRRDQDDDGQEEQEIADVREASSSLQSEAVRILSPFFLFFFKLCTSHDSPSELWTIIKDRIICTTQG